MPVCLCCRAAAHFIFMWGNLREKNQIEPPPPHAIWTIQKCCGSYPPLSRIKVKFLPCFFFCCCCCCCCFFFCFVFFTFVVFLILHLWPFFVFTFMTESILHLWLCIFSHLWHFFFTYDLEVLHLAFLFFTNVTVVTFVTVFTFKVLTGPVAFIFPWTSEKWNSSLIYTMFLHRFS